MKNKQVIIEEEVAIRIIGPTPAAVIFAYNAMRKVFPNIRFSGLKPNDTDPGYRAYVFAKVVMTGE